MVVLCSDSPSSVILFKNCHDSALFRTVKHFTIGRVQTKTSELTENSYWSIPENTHFVQLLITRVQVQTVLSFDLDRHYFSLLPTEMNGEIQRLLNV